MKTILKKYVVKTWEELTEDYFINNEIEFEYFVEAVKGGVIND